MKKESKIVILLLFAGVIYFGIQSVNYTTPQQKIDGLLSSARESFGDNVLFFQTPLINKKIDSLIAKEKYPEALSILDTVNISSDLKYNYQGEILLKQGKARESIYYFNRAIELTEVSNSLKNRAAAYVELGLDDSALLDYHKLADYNYDFTRQIGDIYLKKAFKDSALKYYRLFQSHYPDSTGVTLEIMKLENDLHGSK